MVLKAAFNAEYGIIRENRLQTGRNGGCKSSAILLGSSHSAQRPAFCLPLCLPSCSVQVFDSLPRALLSVGVCGWK